MTRKQLGRSTIDERNRITLIKPVAEILKIKPGEFVYFELDDENTLRVQPYSLRKKPIVVQDNKMIVIKNRQ